MKVGDLVVIDPDLFKDSPDWVDELSVGTVVSIELVGGVPTDKMPDDDPCMIVVLWSGTGLISWETPSMLKLQVA